MHINHILTSIIYIIWNALLEITMCYISLISKYNKFYELIICISTIYTILKHI